MLKERDSLKSYRIFLNHQINSREDSISNIASFYAIKANRLRRHYKFHSSGFVEWKQKEHAKEYLLFPKNIGHYLSIDEVALSQGELYTFITNKVGKGKQHTIIAAIKGTQSESIRKILEKIPLEDREQVKEVTLDMAKNVKNIFPNSYLVIDLFHVVKLVNEALQQIRIKLRWDAIAEENAAIKQAKQKNEKYIPLVFENGDTHWERIQTNGHFLKTKRYTSYSNYTQKWKKHINIQYI